MAEKQSFMRVDEVAQELGVSKSYAYKIVQKLNAELKSLGWEIEYCLKNIARKNRTSHTNGVVGVIMKVDGGYSWFKKQELIVTEILPYLTR